MIKKGRDNVTQPFHSNQWLENYHTCHLNDLKFPRKKLTLSIRFECLLVVSA